MVNNTSARPRIRRNVIFLAVAAFLLTVLRRRLHGNGAQNGGKSQVLLSSASVFAPAGYGEDAETVTQPSYALHEMDCAVLADLPRSCDEH